MSFAHIGLAIASTASLVSLSSYIFLAFRGESATLLSTSGRGLTWQRKIFLGLAAIGFLICMFAGAEAMLFWLSDNWGSVDEDGEFHPARASIAATFTFFGGFALVDFIDRATRNSLFLNVLRGRLSDERKIYEAKSLVDLDEIKSEFTQKLEGLRKKLREDGRNLGLTEIEYIGTYVDLIRLIENRSGHLGLRRIDSQTIGMDENAKALFKEAQAEIENGVKFSNALQRIARKIPKDDRRAVMDGYLKDELELLLEVEAQEELENALEQAREDGDKTREQALEDALEDAHHEVMNYAERPYQTAWDQFRPDHDR